MAEEENLRGSAGRDGDTLSLMLMLFYLLSTLALALMAVVTPQMQSRFGLSGSQTGLLTSVFMFAYGAVGIPAGAAAARWGGRPLAVSCGLFVAGSLVFALSSSYGGFLLGRVLQGLGGGMVLPVSSPVMARYLAPEARNRGWGVFATGKGLGALVGLLLMPSVASLGGFRAVFFATAGMSAVIGVICLAQKSVRALPPQLPSQLPRSTSPRAFGRVLGGVVVNPKVLLLGLFNAASLAVGTGVLVWTPHFLEARYGSSAGVAAYLTAGLALAQLVGAPTGAAGAIRWGRMPVITGSMLAMSVVAGLVPVVPGRVLVFVMVVLVGFFSLAYFSPRFAMIPDVVTDSAQVGPAAGMINLLGFGISTMAPWLFGLALDRGLGYRAGYLVFAAFGFAGVIGSLFFRPPNRLLKNDVSPQGCDGHAQDKDAKSVNSSAIGATEDDELRRTVHPRPRWAPGRDSFFSSLLSGSEHRKRSAGGVTPPPRLGGRHEVSRRRFGLCLLGRHDRLEVGGR